MDPTGLHLLEPHFVKLAPLSVNLVDGKYVPCGEPTVMESRGRDVLIMTSFAAPAVKAILVETL